LFTDIYSDCPIQAEFRVVKQHGRDTVILVDEMGYSFSCNNKGAKQISWRCSKRKRKKCTAVIYTENGWIVSRKNSHSHDLSDLSNAIRVNSNDPIVQEYVNNY
jgi:hypothetical protein